MTALTHESAMLSSPHSDVPTMAPAAQALPEPLVEGLLCGTVKPVRELTASDRNAMFRLMERYFENVRLERFEADLNEKEWVTLLYEIDSSELQGFSTLMRLEEEIDGEPVTAFFSGDTVVSRRYWRETLLPRLWGRLFFKLAEGMGERKVYWFLICSGYKTYRFLPVFFRVFYPCHRDQCPGHIRRIMDRLASRKFPAEYDAERGVVRFREATPLKAGVADVTDQRLKDPHVAFFQEINPGHVYGDELVCLTEVAYDNLTPAGRRVMGLKRGTGP